MPDQAAQVAVRRWSAADPPVPLGPLLRRALDQLAVVGAVFSSVYGPHLALLLHGAGVPAPVLAAAQQSPAAALQVAGQASASTHAVIIDAANRAFVAGLSRGSLVCAGIQARPGHPQRIE